MRIDDLRQMAECRRIRRRLQRFLDRDESAPLTAAEHDEVEAHLEMCDACRELADQFRSLHSSLGRLGAELSPDDEAVDRLRGMLDAIIEGESPTRGP